MKKLFLFGIMICSMFFLSACQITAPFVIVNNSKEFIEITYEVKDINYDNGTPRLKTLKEFSNSESEWREAPKDQYVLDEEKGVVEVKLAPNEVLQIARVDVYWIQENPYDYHFNIKSLNIIGASGSIKLQGNQVFDNFKPEGYSWFTRSATKYAIIYK